MNVKECPSCQTHYTETLARCGDLCFTCSLKEFGE